MGSLEAVATGRLHHQAPADCLSCIAVGADATNHQSAGPGTKLLLAEHLTECIIQGRTLELNHSTALFAQEVVVKGVTVVVVVNDAVAQFDAAEQPSVDQLGQGAVDGGPADPPPRMFEFVDQLLGIEVVMPGKYMLEQLALLFGEPLRFRPAGQVFAEFALWTLGYRNSR